MSQGGATLSLHCGGDGAHGVGSRKRDQLRHRAACVSGPGWLRGKKALSVSAPALPVSYHGP